MGRSFLLRCPCSHWHLPCSPTGASHARPPVPAARSSCQCVLMAAAHLLDGSAQKQPERSASEPGGGGGVGGVCVCGGGREMGSRVSAHRACPACGWSVPAGSWRCISAHEAAPSIARDPSPLLTRCPSLLVSRLVS